MWGFVTFFCCYEIVFFTEDISPTFDNGGNSGVCEVHVVTCIAAMEEILPNFHEREGPRIGEV